MDSCSAMALKVYKSSAGRARRKTLAVDSARGGKEGPQPCKRGEVKFPPGKNRPEKGKPVTTGCEAGVKWGNVWDEEQAWGYQG